MEGEKLVYHPGWVAKVIQVRLVCRRNQLAYPAAKNGARDGNFNFLRRAGHVNWLQLSLQTRSPNFQLYETTLVRHGIMLVGPTGGGKTKIFRCLRTALDKTMGITHKDSRFNPKAIRAQEMYGEVDPSTGEWNTGAAQVAVSVSLSLPR